MKKYYQAALVVTAVISIVSLLIYRHQYNKLRYVLEVFNYFGKYEPRRANSSCVNFNSSFYNVAFNSKFDEPIPSWQRLENDLYVYSAYDINYQSYKEVRAIGIGIMTSILNTQCLIFFENESKPILGNFNFIPISKYSSTEKDSAYRGYNFICSYSSNETPTGITFVTKSNRYLNYAPILPIKTLPQNLGNNSRISVCVMQSTVKSMLPNTMDMMGFINFHSLIGMNNFIVYDNGIPSKFNSKLKEMANDPSSFQRFTYTVIPWNFPFTEIDETIMREIAVTDCLHRSYNSVAYSIVLSWNEYVVPRYHRATIDLIRDVRKTEYATFDRYGVKPKFFCTQQPDNERYGNFTLTLFKKTKCSTASTDRYVYIYHPHEILHAELESRLKLRTTHIRQSLISVNQYKYCEGDENAKMVEDNTVFRFAENMQDSWIFKKYREF